MAASPIWKVYLGKEYRAACKYVEDAAALVALLGDGTTLRCDHALVLWVEGKEDQSAAESYDHVVEVVHRRLGEHRDKVRGKREYETTIYRAQRVAGAGGCTFVALATLEDVEGMNR